MVKKSQSQIWGEGGRTASRNQNKDNINMHKFWSRRFRIIFLGLITISEITVSNSMDISEALDNI